MSEGFDDFEMEDLGRKYPEYDDMNEVELNNEYDSLIQSRLNLLRGDTDNQDKIVSVNERMNYIDCIRENRPNSLADRRAVETTFTDNNDGTITIRRSDEPSTSGIIVPALDLPKNARNKKAFAVEDFIKRNNDRNFMFDTNNIYVIE